MDHPVIRGQVVRADIVILRLGLHIAQMVQMGLVVFLDQIVKMDIVLMVFAVCKKAL